jgi:CRISPR-associated protein Cmr6
MAEKARLRIYKTKKGTLAAQVEFASGKSMPLPSWYEVGQEYDGFECEVEREKGQIINVRVGGRDLPRKEGGRPPTGEAPPLRAGRLAISGLLPEDTREALRNREPDNLGLYLQKLGLRYTEGEDGPRFSFPIERPIRVEPPWMPRKDFFNLLDERRQEILKGSGLEFRRVVLKLRSRLVVGLGAGSVYEVSLALHPLYGFPYSPASAVKGVVRSAAIAEDFGGQEEEALKDPLFRLVFGAEGCRGVVRFFDAYPLQPPTVIRDVMNPHYAPYYQSEGEMPPGDYYNPNPVFFGCVERGTLFVLYLAFSKETIQDVGSKPLDKALLWLEQAFSLYGMGAKTSAGYGLIKVVEGGVKR